MQVSEATRILAQPLLHGPPPAVTSQNQIHQPVQGHMPTSGHMHVPGNVMVNPTGAMNLGYQHPEVTNSRNQFRRQPEGNAGFAQQIPQQPTNHPHAQRGVRIMHYASLYQSLSSFYCPQVSLKLNKIKRKS